MCFILRCLTTQADWPHCKVREEHPFYHATRWVRSALEWQGTMSILWWMGEKSLKEVQARCQSSTVLYNIGVSLTTHMVCLKVMPKMPIDSVTDSPFGMIKIHLNQPCANVHPCPSTQHLPLLIWAPCKADFLKVLRRKRASLEEAQSNFGILEMKPTQTDAVMICYDQIYFYVHMICDV